MRKLRHQQTELHRGHKHEAVSLFIFHFHSSSTPQCRLMAAVMTFQSLPKNKLCAFILLFLLLSSFESRGARKATDDCEMLNHLFALSSHTFFQVLADTKEKKREEIFKQQLGRHPQTPTTRHKSSFEREREKTHQ